MSCLSGWYSIFVLFYFKLVFCYTFSCNCSCPFMEFRKGLADPVVSGPHEDPKLSCSAVSPSLCHRAPQWPIHQWIWVWRSRPGVGRWRGKLTLSGGDIWGPQVGELTLSSIYACIQPLIQLVSHSWTSLFSSPFSYCRSVLGLIHSSPKLSLLSRALSLTTLASKLTKVIFTQKKDQNYKPWSKSTLLIR